MTQFLCPCTRWEQTWHRYAHQGLNWVRTTHLRAKGAFLIKILMRGRWNTYSLRVEEHANLYVRLGSWFEGQSLGSMHARYDLSRQRFSYSQDTLILLLNFKVGKEIMTINLYLSGGQAGPEFWKGSYFDKFSLIPLSTCRNLKNRKIIRSIKGINLVYRDPYSPLALLRKIWVPSVQA